MTRFDFDVIGDTPVLKSRPPEPAPEQAALQPAAQPAPEQGAAQPVQGPQMERRQENAA